MKTSNEIPEIAEIMAKIAASKLTIQLPLPTALPAPQLHAAIATAPNAAAMLTAKIALQAARALTGAVPRQVRIEEDADWGPTYRRKGQRGAQDKPRAPKDAPRDTRRGRVDRAHRHQQRRAPRAAGRNNTRRGVQDKGNRRHRHREGSFPTERPVAHLDTNILLSHHFAEDPNHPYAARLMETLRTRREEMLVSLLTLVKLYAYISRRIGALKPRRITPG
jgi:hypothetical protein